MIAPQCIMIVYMERIVASCPPCIFCAEDIALTTLLTVFPDPQSPPCSSMNCFICAAMTPNLVGALQIIASAHSKSSEEATGTSSFHLHVCAKPGSNQLLHLEQARVLSQVLPPHQLLSLLLLPILPFDNSYPLNCNTQLLNLHLPYVIYSFFHSLLYSPIFII